MDDQSGPDGYHFRESTKVYAALFLCDDGGGVAGLEKGLSAVCTRSDMGGIGAERAGWFLGLSRPDR